MEEDIKIRKADYIKSLPDILPPNFCAFRPIAI